MNRTISLGAAFMLMISTVKNTLKYMRNTKSEEFSNGYSAGYSFGISIDTISSGRISQIFA